MPASTLLARLQRVRPAGRGRWNACCPAHGDRTPSLAITESDDGVVLIHCFAGCGPGDVLDAVGLEWDALFPERDTAGKPRTVSATQALRALAFEATVIRLSAKALHAGEPLSADDMDRLRVAELRVAEALEVVR